MHTCVIYVGDSVILKCFPCRFVGKAAKIGYIHCPLLRNRLHREEVWVVIFMYNAAHR